MGTTLARPSSLWCATLESAGSVPAQPAIQYRCVHISDERIIADEEVCPQRPIKVSSFLGRSVCLFVYRGRAVDGQEPNSQRRTQFGGQKPIRRQVALRHVVPFRIHSRS